MYLAPRSLLLLVALSVPAAHAHDLWLEPAPRGYTVQYGHHPQLDSHGGEVQVPYAPAIVKSAVCVEPGGSQRPAKFGSAYPVHIEGDCAVVHVSTSSGYWTRTTGGTKNLKKTEVAVPLGSWQSFESVKHVAAWGPGTGSPLAAPLEIVPIANPLTLRDGDKLTVRVLADGRPVADAVVTYDGKPRGQTGADGNVNIRVRHGGLQLIQASTRTPHAGPDADEVVHTAALTFVLGAAP